MAPEADDPSEEGSEDQMPLDQLLLRRLSSQGATPSGVWWMHYMQTTAYSFSKTISLLKSDCCIDVRKVPTARPARAIHDA